METITKTHKGFTLEFYPINGKYTVRVKDDEQATKSLLASCKNKSVKVEKLYFFIRGIKEKIDDGVLDNRKEVQMQSYRDENINPIIKLAELCQKKFRSNIETEVLGKAGEDHHPTITVKITLPNGVYMIAEGSNQKIAKQKAAEALLKTI